MAIRTLKNSLPLILKRDFWRDFFDSVQEELNNVRTEKIDPLLTHFEIREISDEDRLIEISKMLGYEPDVTLDDSLAYIKRDVGSIPFRIKKKTTYDAYDHIFRFIPYSGQVFIGYWTTVDLFRAYSETLITSIDTHDVTTPYELLPEINYAEFVEGSISLDQGYFLDDPDFTWTLDLELTRLATKHLFIEYTADDIIVEDATEYLVTNLYLNFLLNAVLYNKKCVEVPHVGVQVTALCDNSGYYDNAYGVFNDWTIDAIKLKSSVILPAFTNENTPTRMAIGIGSQSMESAHTGGSNPIALADQIAIKDIDSINHTYNLGFGGGDWMMAYNIFQGNTLLEEIIDQGDGSDSFSGTLGHFPVVPGSLTIEYLSTPTIYTVQDNSLGSIEGDRAVGTINYATGEWTLSTQKDLPITGELIASGSQSSIASHFLANQNIVAGTFKLYYQISSTDYIGTDDGAGNITGTGITSGTINYVTGEINISFSPSTDGGEDITCDYEYTAFSTPDNLSDIVAISYQVTEDLQITEAGIFNANGNLMAYATFLPVQLNNPNFHLSMQFFIKNASF